MAGCRVVVDESLEAAAPQATIKMPYRAANARGKDGHVLCCNQPPERFGGAGRIMVKLGWRAAVELP